MPDITDLDVLVPEPKQVKFGGQVYAVPADLPMEIFLRMNKAGEYKNEDGTDDQLKQITSLLDTLTDLFTFELGETPDPEQVKQIKDTVDHVLRRRGVKFAFELVQNIYKADDVAAEEAAAADPTPASEPAPQDAA